MPKRFYLTTPIYYVNSVPHIGTTLTTVVADITARYRRLRGEEVWFLTGTDENGTKVKEAAEKQGKTPREFVDQISQAFVDVFGKMNVSYDDFIRTVEPRHTRAVQRLFEILRERGHIYPGVYEGWYDVASETFFKETDLVDGKSPDGNEVQWVSEENWFFRLSAFERPLLEHIEANPGFLLPASRRNEVVSFIKQGLRDMCITRANPGWGIPVPGDDSKVIYVWFDALINYLAATGWPDDPTWDEKWPADVHWMAKEIFTRFHATLWPAMLMGAGLPLPKTVIAHGWFTFGDAKMSKSKGNVIAPLELADEIAAKTGCGPKQAVDAVRYSLAVLLPYEGDTNYTRDEVDKRYNADLANDLGNALNRSLAMAHKFVDGAVPDAPPEAEAVAAVETAKAEVEAAMTELKIDRATEAAMGVARFLNKYIDTRAPWALAKAESPELPGVIRSMLLCLRAAEALVRPVMPWSADAIADQIGLPPLTDWNAIGKPESIPAGTKLGRAEPLFPRIDPKKAAEAASKLPGEPASKPPKPENPDRSAEKSKPEAPVEPIDIADFMRVQLRVGRVLEAEPIDGSDKLLKLQVMVGDEKRQIVAGIRQSYQPIDLIGRQVVVVANLKPAKLRGVESQGMLLAADNVDGSAILLQPDFEAPEGARVH
ncbi:MAG: methionine--tRNA ligase [Fimbriimonadaceae bacterium]